MQCADGLNHDNARQRKDETDVDGLATSGAVYRQSLYISCKAINHSPELPLSAVQLVCIYYYSLFPYGAAT